MRKDILLSLLAVGAVPTAALANIDVTEKSGIGDVEKWQVDGLGSYDTTDATKLFTVTGASASSVTLTIADKTLPKGVYTIDLGGSENVKISINGVEGNTVNYSGSGAITVKVEGKENGDWNIDKNITMAVKSDFPAAKEALEGLRLAEPNDDVTLGTELKSIVVGEGYPKALTDEQKKLDEEATALAKEIQNVNEDLAKLTEDNENGEFATAIKIYTDLGLAEYDPEDEESLPGYAATVAETLNKIAKHNADVDQLAKWVANYDANQAQKTQDENDLNKASKTSFKTDSEWVKGQSQDAIDAFNVALKAAQDAIKDGYYDVWKEIVDPLDLTAAALKAKDAAVAVFQTAAADWDVYSNLEENKKAIEDAYKKAFGELMAESGSYVTGELVKLTNLKDEAIANLETITEPEGASSVLIDGREVPDYVDYVLAEINGKVAEVKAHMAASDAAYADQIADWDALDAALKAVEEAIAALPDDEIWGEDEDGNPVTVKSGHEKAAQELRDKLTEIKAAIEANKANHACVDATYDDPSGDISDLAAAVAVDTAKAADWIAWNNDLEKLEKQLKKAQDYLEAADKKIDLVDLVGQFAEAKASCEAAIEASKKLNNSNLQDGTYPLSDSTVDKVQYAYAEEGVKEYCAKSKEAADAFIAAADTYKKLQDKIDSLTAKINGADVLDKVSETEWDASGKKPALTIDTKSGVKADYTAKAKAHQEAIDVLKDGMKDAASKKADAIYEAIKAVTDAFDDTTIADAIDADIAAFAADLTAGNWEALQSLETAFLAEFAAADGKTLTAGSEKADDVTPYGIPGYAALKALFADVPATETAAAVPGYSTVIAGFGAKIAAAADDAALKTVNDDIVKTYNDLYAAVKALENKAVDAYNDYWAYKSGSIWRTYKDVESEIEKLDAPANKTYRDQKRYKDVVDPKDALDEKILAAYEALNITKELKDEADAFKKDTKAVRDLLKHVKALHENHDKMIDDAAETIKYISNTLEKVKNSNYNESVVFDVDGKEMTLADIIEAIETIQHDGIQEANDSVTAQYKRAEISDDETYTKLKEEVEAYFNAITTTYEEQVMKYNEETMKAYLVDEDTKTPLKDALDAAYKKYVHIYNSATKETESEAYNAYVQALEAEYGEEFGHSKIQYCYELMRTLNEECQAILDAAMPVLGEDKFVVEDEFDGVLDKKAFDAVKDKMQNALNEVRGLTASYITKVDAFAKTWIAANDPATDITDAEGYMSKVGMDSDVIDDILEPYKLQYVLAQSLLAVPATPGEDGSTGATVDGATIVNSGKIDLYLANIELYINALAAINVNVNAELTQYWNNLYADAVNELTELGELFTTYAAQAGGADLSDAKADLEDAYAKSKALDKDAQADSKKDDAKLFSDNLADTYIPELEALLKKANDAVAVAKAAYDANVDYAQALADLNSAKDDLDAALAEMHSIIGSLGLSKEDFASIPTSAADEYFDTFQSKLNESTPDVSSSKAYQSLTENAIDAAYAQAYEVEREFVESLLTEVEKAFNNLVDEGADEAQLKGLDEQISAVRNALKNIPTGSAKDDVEALKALEDALYNIGIGDLPDNSNVSDEVLADLGKSIDNVQALLDEVTAACETLNETLAYVDKDPYSIDDLAQKLEDLVNAINSDNNIETSKSYYQNQLAALRSVLLNAKKSIINEQAKADDLKANKDAYLAAYEQLSEVEALYNEALQIISEYEYATSDNLTAWYDLTVKKVKADIEENYAKGTSVANKDIVDKRIEELKDEITAGLYKAAKQEEENWRDAIWSLITWDGGEAYYAVYYSGVHANQEELERILWNELFSPYWNIYSGSNVDECNENIAAYKELVKKAYDLIADAEAYAYEPGDLNHDGRVTTADFVKLVDYILGKQAMPAEGTVEFEAADLNGNGEIGVGDAVVLMRKVNKVSTLAAAARAPRRSAMDCSATLVNGSLNLNSNFEVASVMVDLRGVTENDITLGTLAAGMELMVNTLNDGTVRVVLISEDGTTLAGNEGTILNIRGNAVVAQAVAADLLGREYTVVGEEVTGIDLITDSIKNAGEKIYNLGGQMMNGLKKGINIIRNADGSSSKVIK